MKHGRRVVGAFEPEIRIGRKLECLDSMRLQAKRPLDALHGGDRESGHPRELIRNTLLQTFQRLHNDRLDTDILDRARGAGATVHSPLGKSAAAPFAD